MKSSGQVSSRTLRFLLVASFLLTIVAATAQLKMAIEICRHGARSPVSQQYNVTQTYWPDGLGMLTEMGERQHYLLGRELRRRYIDEYKILDQNYNSSQLLVYSTFRERTYQSAQAQLLGLYPPGMGPILSQAQLNRASLPISLQEDEELQSLYTQVNKDLGYNSIEYLYQTIPIYQFEEKDDFILRAFSERTCSKILDHYISHWNTDELRDLQNYYYETLFSPLSVKLGVSIPNDWGELLRVTDEILCSLFDQRSLHFNITTIEKSQLEQFLRDEFYIRRFGSSDAVRLASSELKRFIVQKFLEKITNQNDLRFLILSSHDSIVSLILAALNMTQQEAPPFASTVIFELWNIDNKNQIKLLYDDKELDLFKFCYGHSSTSRNLKCEFEAFQTRMLEQTFTDLKQECLKINDLDLLVSEAQSHSLMIISPIVALTIGTIAYFIHQSNKKKKAGSNLKTASNQKRQQFELVEEEVK